LIELEDCFAGACAYQAACEEWGALTCVLVELVREMCKCRCRPAWGPQTTSQAQHDSRSKFGPCPLSICPSRVLYLVSLAVVCGLPSHAASRPLADCLDVSLIVWQGAQTVVAVWLSTLFKAPCLSACFCMRSIANVCMCIERTNEPMSQQANEPTNRLRHALTPDMGTRNREVQPLLDVPVQALVKHQEHKNRGMGSKARQNTL